MLGAYRRAEGAAAARSGAELAGTPARAGRSGEGLGDQQPGAGIAFDGEIGVVEMASLGDDAAEIGGRAAHLVGCDGVAECPRLLQEPPALTQQEVCLKTSNRLNQSQAGTRSRQTRDHVSLSLALI